MIIPSSSCGAGSPPQDALVPMVGAVGRVTSSVENVTVVLSVPTTAELHMCA